MLLSKTVYGEGQGQSEYINRIVHLSVKYLQPELHNALIGRSSEEDDEFHFELIIIPVVSELSLSWRFFVSQSLGAKCAFSASHRIQPIRLV